MTKYILMLCWALCSMVAQAQTATLVADINKSGAAGSSSEVLGEFNNKVYFSSDQGNRNLWVSDGTTENTKMLIEYTPNNTPQYSLVSVGDIVYAVVGRQLWKIENHTTATMLADDYTEHFSKALVRHHNNKLVIFEDEIWQIDLLNNELSQLSPLEHSIDREAINAVFFHDQHVYLFARSNYQSSTNLYQVNLDTGEQALIQQQIQFSYSDNEFVHQGNSLFFVGSENNKSYIYKFNLETTKLQIVSKVKGSSKKLTTNANGFFFIGDKGTSYYDSNTNSIEAGLLWLDGTASVSPFAMVNDRGIFEVRGGFWISDGTAKGSYQLLSSTQVQEQVCIREYQKWVYHELNGKLYFRSTCDYEEELWQFDLEEKLFSPVFVDKEDNFSVYNRDFYVAKGLLWFIGFTASQGHELWVSDGSYAGTKILVDANVTPTTNAGSDIKPMTHDAHYVEFNNHVYFVATYTDGEKYLWQLNKTTNQVERVKSELFVGMQIMELAANSQKLFIRVYNPKVGRSLATQIISMDKNNQLQTFMAAFEPNEYYVFRNINDRIFIDGLRYVTEGSQDKTRQYDIASHYEYRDIYGYRGGFFVKLYNKSTQRVELQLVQPDETLSDFVSGDLLNSISHTRLWVVNNTIYAYGVDSSDHYAIWQLNHQPGSDVTFEKTQTFETKYLGNSYTSMGHVHPYHNGFVFLRRCDTTGNCKYNPALWYYDLSTRTMSHLSELGYFGGYSINPDEVFIHAGKYLLIKTDNRLVKLDGEKGSLVDDNSGDPKKSAYLDGYFYKRIRVQNQFDGIEKTALFSDKDVSLIDMTEAEVTGSGSIKNFLFHTNNALLMKMDTGIYGAEAWKFERDLSDTDKDGIPDEVENSWGLNPDNAADGTLDLDNDGVTNAAEHQLGSSLTHSDSDHDGLPDGWEVSHGLNPILFDAHIDTDKDGLDNATEFGLGTSPTNSDTDNDNVLDIEDAFPLDSSESLDTDNDGSGNNTDLDDDNDGTPDSDDDFPLDSTQTTFKLIAELTFNDANLASCVLANALANRWTAVNQVTQLKCASKNIVDLRGIDVLFALTVLDLRKNVISDITVLANLTALTQLKLAKNAINDLSAIANLTQLTFLSLSSNPFEDDMLSYLTNLNQLEVLYLRDNQLSNLSSLANLTHLTRLYLRNNQIVDIDWLAQLTQLSTLRLNNNLISDISVLFALTHARAIDLKDNEQINCVDLDALIETLGSGIVTEPVSCGNISDIVFEDSNLETCVLETASSKNWLTVDEVTALACPAKLIEKLSGLEHFSQLTKLDLRKNNLDDITLLSRLTNLEELKLAKNNITDIASLSGLTSLTVLSLSDNSIDDTMLNHLANLNLLRVLYLRDNQISDISALANLTEMTRLYLRNNQISNIESLVNLTKLNIVRLNNNMVGDIRSLFNLLSPTNINLVDNDGILCTELDALVGMMGGSVVNRPTQCDSNSPYVNPLAIAGEDVIVNEHQGVTIIGIGTDDSGYIASFQWRQISGPAVQFSSLLNRARLSFDTEEVNEDQVLVFRLTVTDYDGAKGSDDVTVLIKDTNKAPIANAGLDVYVNEGESGTVIGSAMDVDGQVVAYQWEQVSGPDVQLSTPNNSTADFDTFEVPESQELVFKLTVTDDQGATDSDEMTILIRNINLLPTANAGPDISLLEETQMMISGSGSDPDGQIVSYSWRSIGYSIRLQDDDTATPTFIAQTVNEDRVYTLELTVTDNNGGTATQIMTVTVIRVNNLPNSYAGDDRTIIEPTTARIYGGSSGDSDGSIVQYQWQQLAGNTVILTTEDYGSATFEVTEITTADELVFELTVTDNEGAISTDTVSIKLIPKGVQNWSYYAFGDLWNSSPSIAQDGTIYIGSSNDKKGILAFNTDGSEKWHAAIGKIYTQLSIAADGTIYASTDDDKFHAVNPNGSLKWSIDTQGYVRIAAAIAPDGTLYFGTRDGLFYALNPDGTIKWTFTAKGDIGSSASIGKDGTIYFATGSDKLYAMNPDGTVKWSTDIGSYRSAPAIGSNGMLYLCNDVSLYAINPDGTIAWQFDAQSFANTSPVIASDGTIYFGSQDNNFYAINPDGSEKWIYKTNDSIIGSPVIAKDNSLYISSYDGFLYALSADGQPLWAFDVGIQNSRLPTITAQGNVLISNRSYLYSIKGDNGGLSDGPWPKPGRNNQNTSSVEE